MLILTAAPKRPVKRTRQSHHSELELAFETITNAYILKAVQYTKTIFLPKIGCRLRDIGPSECTNAIYSTLKAFISILFARALAWDGNTAEFGVRCCRQRKHATWSDVNETKENPIKTLRRRVRTRLRELNSAGVRAAFSGVNLKVIINCSGTRCLTIFNCFRRNVLSSWTTSILNCLEPPTKVLEPQLETSGRLMTDMWSGEWILIAWLTVSASVWFF